ncbi:MAG: branched-chain amino acid ABC transporter permease [Candidatus Euphemobacter frigidus]|nr:branched-chain amino acid ABC transporter permease [Candidatus Euphemobacter frigidus]MDP8275687.1 branched-chain amino acid ABC transporter permease [Candidatus Euphemobacter frigidus]
MTLGSQILQYIISGISIGSIYALVALGFNIIYNTTGIINFAQGEFVMLGGITAASLVTIFHVPILIAFLAAVIIVTAAGAFFERLAIHPLKNPSVITLIIITIAGSILLKGIAMFIWGKDTYFLPSFSGDRPIHFLGAAILPQTVWILGITGLVVILLSAFFKFTLAGKAMRAVASNRMAASLVGINVKKMVLFSFALSAAVGAVGGIIIAPIALMDYDKGAIFALKGFAVAALGGIGNFGGAIAAGLILGILEALGAGLISSHYKDAIALMVLLLVLFLKPSGIFGSAQESRLKKF